MGVSAPTAGEPPDGQVIVTFGGGTIAESRRSSPVQETSHLRS
ncbi:MAG: hypothetical protein QOJ23_5863, partial [Actinomycetota bacterium]|nr:hypothetical protein [Actinomycetota bacterium]